MIVIDHHRHFGFLSMIVACVAVLVAPSSHAQSRLEGEFDDIDLGRKLVGTDHFPTIRELRESVRQNPVRTVLTLKLYGDKDNHHLPVWSHDGQRLAFQRSRVGVSSSKILIYDALSQFAPNLLSKADSAYDYMFRWGINAPASYVFVRLTGNDARSQIYYSSDGESPQPLNELQGAVSLPSLYERTDGVHRLVVDRNGTIASASWGTSAMTIKDLIKGTAPRWSDDGERLLYLKDVGRRGDLPKLVPTERTIASEKDRPLSNASDLVVRSPTYSPDGKSVAWFEREVSERSAWRIQVASLEKASQSKAMVDDVVVNQDFKTEGPAWDSSSRRIWCFTVKSKTEQYYPFVAVDIATSGVQVVDYPREITTPRDVSVNPMTGVPEIAFVAHLGVAQDLFVSFLNHF